MKKWPEYLLIIIVLGLLVFAMSGCYKCPVVYHDVSKNPPVPIRSCNG